MGNCISCVGPKADSDAVSDCETAGAYDAAAVDEGAAKRGGPAAGIPAGKLASPREVDGMSDLEWLWNDLGSGRKFVKGLDDVDGDGLPNRGSSPWDSDHPIDVLVVAEKAGAEDNRADVDSPVITGIVSGRTKTSGWPHAMVDATRECVRVEVYQPDHSGSELEVSSDVSVIDEVIGKLVGQNCVDEEVTMENSAISLPSCSSEVDVAEHNASNISAVQESCPDPAGSVASAEAEDEDLEDSGSDTPLPVSARVHAFELLSPTRKTAKAEQQDSAALEVKDLQVEAETHAEGQTTSSEGAEMASGDGEASGGDNEVDGNELLEGTQEDAGTEDDDNGTIDGADASEGGGCWEVAPGSPNTVPIVKHASGTVSPEEERSVDSLEAFVRLEAELEEGRPGRGARGHADEDEDVSEDKETWLFCADGARRQQSQDGSQGSKRSSDGARSSSAEMYLMVSADMQAKGGVSAAVEQDMQRWSGMLQAQLRESLEKRGGVQLAGAGGDAPAGAGDHLRVRLPGQQHCAECRRSVEMFDENPLWEGGNEGEAMRHDLQSLIAQLDVSAVARLVVLAHDCSMSPSGDGALPPLLADAGRGLLQPDGARTARMEQQIDGLQARVAQLEHENLALKQQAREHVCSHCGYCFEPPSAETTLLSPMSCTAHSEAPRSPCPWSPGPAADAAGLGNMSPWSCGRPGWQSGVRAAPALAVFLVVDEACSDRPVRVAVRAVLATPCGSPRTPGPPGSAGHGRSYLTMRARAAIRLARECMAHSPRP